MRIVISLVKRTNVVFKRGPCYFLPGAKFLMWEGFSHNPCGSKLYSVLQNHFPFHLLDCNQPVVFHLTDLKEENFFRGQN